ncbi:MAG: hypothetical protein ACRDP7_12640 [Trebonia sp.]
MPKHSPGGADRRPSTASRPAAGTDKPGDEVLAALLIRMWTLASGRTLRRDVPPDQLSAEELIAFWADDMTPRTGRHARTEGTYNAPRVPEPGKAARPRRRKRRQARASASKDREEPAAGPAAA